jgi:hypothetical protein
MMTKTGFVSLFWDDLKTLQCKQPKITHAEVYERMEKEYSLAFNQRRYANFKSFRTRRDEKR